MRHQPDHGAGDGRLAAARFADQREGLAAADRQADAGNRVDTVGDAAEHPALQVEADADILEPCHRPGVVAVQARRIGPAQHPVAGQIDRRPRRPRPHPRDRRQKRAGIGGPGLGEDRRRRPFLDHPPRLHHDHPVGHLGDHAHVMGDQDDRGAEVALQVAQEVEHLALHRHVKRRRRLVGDQHLGAQRQRHGDHHPLAHPARQLMRILSEPPRRFRQAHRAQRLDRPCPRPGTRHRLMGADRLDQLGADRQHRVERGHRFLKDHRDPVAADRPHPGLAQPGQIARAQPDRAGGQPHRRRRQKPHDRQRGDRLARAAFAGDRQRLAAHQGEGKIRDQRVQPGLGIHRDLKPGDAQHRAGLGDLRGRCGPGPGHRRPAHSKTARGK